MKSMRHMLQKSFNWLLWLLLATVAIYFVFLEGWRDATSGRFHRKALETFANTHGITNVEIYLLMGEESEREDTTFPIRPKGSEHPVYGSVALSGEELEGFLDVWRYQEPGMWRQALCHHPAYGFRLYRGDRQVTETSICWECSNYYVTVYPGISTWYGFASDAESGQELLKFCDARLPYKRPAEASAPPESDQAADEQAPQEPESKSE